MVQQTDVPWSSEQWAATCRINFLAQSVHRSGGGKNSSKLKYGSRKWGLQANFLRVYGCYSDYRAEGKIRGASN